MYFLGRLYLSCHDLECIKAPIIAPSSESQLGRLYGAGSQLEQKALELNQDHVEETRLDYLVIEIIECKKRAVARRIQSQQNLLKGKKAVEILAMMLRQSYADNVAAIANEKKLKEEKESKGGIMARTLSNLSKSIKSSSTTALPLISVSPQTFISSFSHVLSLNNSNSQSIAETANTA